MSLQISSVGIPPVLLAENTSTNNPHTAAAKVAAPPPPPPPPPKDTVSLSGTIKVLQSEGESPVQIAQALGLPLQTVSIDLGTSFIEATLAAAPTIPGPSTAN